MTLVLQGVTALAGLGAADEDFSCAADCRFDGGNAVTLEACVSWVTVPRLRFFFVAVKRTGSNLPEKSVVRSAPRGSLSSVPPHIQEACDVDTEADVPTDASFKVAATVVNAAGNPEAVFDVASDVDVDATMDSEPESEESESESREIVRPALPNFMLRNSASSSSRA